VTQQLVENVFTATVQIVAGNNTPPAPLPLPALPLTISDFDTAIEAVTLGDNPTNKRYNFAAMGRVTNVRTPSPFGELVGRAAAYSAEFDSTGDTTLFFFGGFVAGSHSTWVPVATGSVQVNPNPSLLR
jgi:hypothetical protein